MYIVRTSSGSALSARGRDAAERLARSLLRLEANECLCWVGNRLIVSNSLGHLTGRWAQLEAQ